MRARLLPRWLPALALLAIALLVLAPLVSRALPPAAGSAASAAVAMSGHVSAAAEPAGARMHAHHHPAHPVGAAHDAATPVAHQEPPSTAVDPHASHEMGVDCDYCLIAARMIGLLVALLLVLVAWPAMVHRDPARQPALRVVVPGTLGARGPPHALAR